MNEDEVKKEVETMIDKSVGEKTEEIKKSIEQSVDEKTKAAVEEKTVEISKKSAETEAKIKQLEEKNEEVKKELEEKTETIKAIGKRLKGMSNSAFPERKDLKSAIKNAILENSDTLKSGLDKDQKLNMVVKEAGTILRSNFEDGEGHLTDYQRGLTRIPTRTPILRDLINTFPVTLPFVSWAEQMEGEGGAAPTGEGKRKPKMDLVWKAFRAEVKKIPVYTKVSTEAIDDIDFVADEIANALTESVMLEEDYQILRGDGTGYNYTGIYSYAPEFEVTDTKFNTFYKKVANATRIDVLRTAAAIIKRRHFIPSVVLINPEDSAMIDMTKDSTGNYIMSPFSLSKNVTINNLIILEDETVEPGEFLMGDMSKSNYGIRQEFRMEASYTGDDFIDNLLTFRAELRGVHYIKKNHKNAFLKGKFDDALVMISGDGAVQKVEVVNDITLNA